MAVPNQLFVDIHKTDNGKYLQINTADWIKASQTLPMASFQVYLYLANIQNGYKNWELSKADIMKTLGISESSYKRAKADLIKAGYLVDRGKNHLDFFTSPLTVNDDPKENTVKNGPVVDRGQKWTSNGFKNEPVIGSKMNIEIEKEYKNKIEKEGFVGPSLRSGTTPQQQQEEVVGEVSREQISSLIDAKLEQVSENIVRITNIPREGLYRVV